MCPLVLPSRHIAHRLLGITPGWKHPFADAADKPYVTTPVENHRPEAIMDEDDLPPPPRQRSGGLGAALGRTVSGFLWIAVFIGIIAVVLYGLKHWL
jgi:hypothetical protein